MLKQGLMFYGAFVKSDYKEFPSGLILFELAAMHR